MSSNGETNKVLTLVAVGVGTAIGFIIGLQLFAAKDPALDRPSRDPVSQPAPTPAAASATPAYAGIPTIESSAPASRQFVWSSASGSRSGSTTIHWHACTWASRISAANRATLTGTWAQVTNRVGGPCRRCGVCEQLD